MSRRDRVAGALLLVLLLAGTSGCATYRLAQQASLAEENADWDAAVEHYLELVERQPSNVRFKTALLRARLKASQEHFSKGQRFREAGVLERALIEFQEAVQLDSTNQYAQVELDQLRSEIARVDRDGSPMSLEELKKKTRDQPAQPPVLSPRSKDPISLDFPKPVSIFDIYRALGKAFGLNILFDPALKDQDLAIELRDVTAQNALETLMRAAGHFYKVVDEHSIIIAADNPQNRKNYEDLVIQTFFLSNAEVKDVLTLLRSLIGAKNIATNEELNAVTIRDTADKVKVAQRMIEGIDKSRSEVIVDVELIEVDTNRIREIGVSLSQNQITQSLGLGEDAKVRLSDLKYLNQSSWILTIPSIIYDFVKTNADAQLLAKPQIRISEGEKGKVHIGDRVPIPVTSFNSAQTSGGNIIPITSFQYQDVGIKIDIEPRVHHNKEVTLKLQIEVSQITGYQDGGGGQRQPIIGTRTIESTIRLKDGETNFLAGLIRTDEVQGETGIPGLSDIPIIGRLFGKIDEQHQAQRRHADADAAHHPHSRDHRRRPDADLGRHRVEHLFPRRYAAGRVRGGGAVRRRPVVRRGGGEDPRAGAAAAARAAIGRRDRSRTGRRRAARGVQSGAGRSALESVRDTASRRPNRPTRSSRTAGRRASTRPRFQGNSLDLIASSARVLLRLRKRPAPPAAGVVVGRAGGELRDDGRDRHDVAGGPRAADGSPGTRPFWSSRRSFRGTFSAAARTRRTRATPRFPASSRCRPIASTGASGVAGNGALVRVRFRALRRRLRHGRGRRRADPGRRALRPRVRRGPAERSRDPRRRGLRRRRSSRARGEPVGEPDGGS